MTEFKETTCYFQEIKVDVLDDNFDGEVVNEEKLLELTATPFNHDSDEIVGDHFDDPFRGCIEEVKDDTALDTFPICDDLPLRRGGWNTLPMESLPPPGFSPQSIIDYCSQRRNQELIGSLKGHLLYEGWIIQNKEDAKGIRSRYISPEGNIYYSLLKICREMKKKQDTVSSSFCREIIEKQERVNSGSVYEDIHRNSKLSVTSHSLAKGKPPTFLEYVEVEPECCPQALVELSEFEFMHGKVIKGVSNIDLKTLRLKAKKHLSFEGWKFWNARKGQSQELRYTAPNGKVYVSLQQACKAWVEENKEASKSKALIPSRCLALQEKCRSNKSVSADSLNGVFQRDEEFEEKSENSKCSSITNFEHSSIGAEIYERMCTRSSRKHKAVADSSKPLVMLSSAKHHNARSVISWLMKNGVIYPMQQESYINKSDGSIMASGSICKKGIRCNCCNKVYNISAFEAHAGSSYHRPAANIYLTDGRSLQECQNEVWDAPKCKRYKRDTSERTNTENLLLGEDDICSICRHDGNLLLCDGCPSAFHKACVGLEDLPSGEWFCASCQCVVCGQGDYSGDTKEDLWCGQCERKYHLGCLREQGDARDQSFPSENWFCSEECLQISVRLSGLLGKLNTTSQDGVSWTLLRSRREDDAIDGSVVKTKSKEHKLLQAIKVLHECFEPVVEPLTKSDLVTDVVFCRRSLLKRLNFNGFYTMLLQKGDKLVTVATIRIFGGKVAEMPLIGTRFKYRRKGMCRLLVKELEKVLFSLGVERLFLPAATQLLHTWTTSFGFSKLAQSERMKFLPYIFLDFQGTTMCQKLLTSETQKMAMKPRETQENIEVQSEGLHVSSKEDQPVVKMNSGRMPAMSRGVAKITHVYRRRAPHRTN
ncbi:hypothetical protein H6P81_020758 [Aristolochia fimbriata]|uniref:PHD finger transcription factor n=1 Tax=Aristolochia fimbriata TaxID=158543 RepID=A0AAV7DWB1_ARIFI|nr:hypothetical protein H6P81_020758 [Aristolochia fimbriata]